MILFKISNYSNFTFKFFFSPGIRDSCFGVMDFFSSLLEMGVRFMKKEKNSLNCPFYERKHMNSTVQYTSKRDRQFKQKPSNLVTARGLLF